MCLMQKDGRKIAGSTKHCAARTARNKKSSDNCPKRVYNRRTLTAFRYGLPTQRPQGQDMEVFMNRRNRMLHLVLCTLIPCVLCLAACSDDDDDDDGARFKVVFKGASDVGILSDGTDNDQEKGVELSSSRYVWVGASSSSSSGGAGGAGGSGGSGSGGSSSTPSSVDLYLTMPDDYTGDSAVIWTFQDYTAGAAATTVQANVTADDEDPSVFKLSYQATDLPHVVWMTGTYITSSGSEKSVKMQVPVTKAPEVAIAVVGAPTAPATSCKIKATVNGVDKVLKGIATKADCSSAGFAGDAKKDTVSAAASLYLGARGKTGDAVSGCAFQNIACASQVATIKANKVGSMTFDVYESSGSAAPFKLTKIGSFTVNVTHSGATVKV